MCAGPGKQGTPELVGWCRVGRCVVSWGGGGGGLLFASCAAAVGYYTQGPRCPLRGVGSRSPRLGEGRIAVIRDAKLSSDRWEDPKSEHSKPIPLYLPLSGVLSACARRWAQFRVGFGSLGDGVPEVIAGEKKIFAPAVITAKFQKKNPRFCDFFTPNGVVTSSVWSGNLEPSTQQQSHKRLGVDI